MGGVRVSRPAAGPVRARSRPEGIRWVRADGSPNWSQRIRRREGDARRIASRPAITVAKTTPILGAAEEMARRSVRGLVVVSGDKLEGVLLATDIVNYLGGGPYYRIAETRHRGSLYSALRESVQPIMNPNPLFATIDSMLEDIVKIMVREGVGFLPVTYGDGTVYGVITERDVIRSLEPLPYDKKIEDYMTSTIVTVGLEDTILKAAQLMVRHGFRRLPVVGEDGSIKGVVTAKDIVSFFGSHEAFRYAPTGRLSEAMDTPVYVIARSGYYTIHPKLSVADAAKIMIERRVDSLIVVEEGEALGIITERDILVASALEEG